MKMKNLLIGGMSLALVACISVGGTLAYLSAQTGTATNTFTMNGLTLVVSETADAATSNGDYKQKLKSNTEGAAGVASVSTPELAKDDSDGIAYTDILPGAVMSKKPVITVKGKHAACYVFACVENPNGLLTIEKFDGFNWKQVATTTGKTLYVYTDGTTNAAIVPEGNADVDLPVLFTEVKLSENLTEAVTLGDIVIEGYAYQAYKNGVSCYDAALEKAKTAFGF